ncbi:MULTISPECIES: WhiB family transcriptional regulator [unclassified Nocardiopsis]|uniref:WhiB family transcriptional regulator n=1 Tax=Nocardiopsis TaxID=2013 RepID=UPI00387B10A4
MRPDDLRYLPTGQLYAAISAADTPCADPVNTALFFEPDTSASNRGETKTAKKLRIRSARVLCAGCPARELCLELADRERPTVGIWGGLTADELRYRRAA